MLIYISAGNMRPFAVVRSNSNYMGVDGWVCRHHVESDENKSYEFVGEDIILSQETKDNR